jgi:hypothetical protein
MIAWLAWFFLVLPLFLLDGYLAARWLPLPCLTLALVLFLGLRARPGAVPGLLACAALARGLLMEGDAAGHLLVLGVPVAALIVARGAVVLRHPLVVAAVSAALAILVAKLPVLLARFGEAAPRVASLNGGQILWAALLVPVAAALLRRLPPLSAFAEEGP